jgi:hypothetical protein
MGERVESELIKADYVVVGSGAMGMAFVDTLVAESNASVVMIDRHHRPGGHWNTAYPFVRLHQASAFYGVASRPLGSDRILSAGVNAGFYEVASAAEICSYFDNVMHETLLPTGRVRYFPMSEYRGDFAREHGFVSLVSGRAYRVEAKMLVDATYTDTQTPSTQPPSFEVAPGVSCVTVNDLPSLTAARERYVVIGAGKTAMDACLWLLEAGVDPGRIRWIKPREAWLQDRAHVQPGPLSVGLLTSFADNAEAAANAESIDDLFERLSAARSLVRVDETVKPTMYRCATVSQAELALLRQIKDVVRLGRVKRIEADRVVLEQGEVPAGPGDLYVHCAASGIKRRAPIPVFTESKITLQALRWCAPNFSAALIAHLEATRDDLAAKNVLSRPIPYPETANDWIRVCLGHMLNDFVCRSDGELRAWANRCRMNPAAAVAQHASPKEEPWRSAIERMREHGAAAVAKLQRFEAELDRDQNNAVTR